MNGSQVIEIGLGTVQFGLPYGPHAAEGLLSVDTVNQILRTAHSHEISFLDTASAYGCSEERIGNFYRVSKETIPTIATKASKLPVTVWHDVSKIKESFISDIAQSKKNLQVRALPIFMLHQSDLELLSSKSVSEVMMSLLDEKFISTAGISVYERDEAEVALTLPWVSWIQCPVNFFDHRFLDPQFLDAVKDRNVKLIARSIFLQGVLTDSSPLPEVKRKSELMEIRNAVTEIVGIDNLSQAALRFVFHNQREHFAVGLIGVYSPYELEWNCRIVKDSSALSHDLIAKIKEFSTRYSSRKLYDPRSWDK